MQHLVASSTEVKGPVPFDAVLPVPAPRKPFFGDRDAHVGAEARSARDGTRTWRPRLPDSGRRSTRSPVDEKALYYRAPYTSQAGRKPVSPGAGRLTSSRPARRFDPDQIVDLTNRLQPDGRLDWDVPAGSWTVLRFGRRNNGAVTRPAPAPGLGFECDKFDAEAFDAHFDAYLGTLLRKAGPRKPGAGGGWTMLHIDSWEMGAQNWSPTFRQEFRRRRGYDPLPYPAGLHRAGSSAASSRANGSSGTCARPRTS